MASPSNSPLASLPPIVVSDREDPPWTGWSVLWIAIFAVMSIAVLGTLTIFAVQRWMYPQVNMSDVAAYPLVAISAQVVVYIVVFLFMVNLLTWRGLPFWRSVRWNWPQNPMLYLLGGVALSLALQGLAHWLPMPKELPMDRFFQTQRQAWVLAIFGVTMAPLMEELFFRGFLYPVLARRVGVIFSVLLTAAAFSMVHAPQLAKAWGPVLIIFLVGLALTIVRVASRSVAAGLLMHVAYNGTLSILLFVATDGFRHLERLKQ